MKDGKRLVNHNAKKRNKLEHARTLKKRLLMRNIENGFDKVKAMKNTYKKLELDCLVVLGGSVTT